jgi:hypothetical protein
MPSRRRAKKAAARLTVRLLLGVKILVVAGVVGCLGMSCAHRPAQPPEASTSGELPADTSPVAESTSAPSSTASASASPEPNPAETPASTDASSPQSYDTQFPLPDSVENFQAVDGNGEDGINFQTDLSLDEAIAFYRDALGKEGLTERSINTSITDSVFSLVFDGSANGKALVVQGVALGDKTNLNLRFEDL